MSIRQNKLPIAALERIDDICADFERQWQAENLVAIESLISDDLSETEREVLLAELIALDVDYRHRRGLSLSKQDYLDRFPDDIKAIDDAFEDRTKKSGRFEPPTIGRMTELFPSLDIIELIGAGGMGAVYRARQTGLDRQVALKILPEEFDHDIKFALRFTREARTLAKLSHPNIVSVYEFGKVEETYFFLMDFIDGTTLRDVVQASQLDPQHALTIVPYLCDALQYAHDKGVVHRDIKPENILIAKDGSVKIADFGLSRILGNESQHEQLTATHQVMGTPRYMAPEQLEGAHGVDHRADIYSLGVVIYEMLTGELPIGRFEVPSKKAQIDVRLDEVVLRTLEKEPQRRYQHASQIKSDVQTITSGRKSDLESTIAYRENSVTNQEGSAADLQQQELAGRMLLTRRELMKRVEKSLRPLFWGQLLLVLIGIALILLGVWCWAQNTSIPHRFANGLLLHVYGVIVIAQALSVLTRIRRIDYSKPVEEIRSNLDSLLSANLRSAFLVGFVWWLLWIPIAVAIGFDEVVLYQNSLIPSLVFGSFGIGISVWLFRSFLISESRKKNSSQDKLAGKSIASAYLALEEIENAKIR